MRYEVRLLIGACSSIYSMVLLKLYLELFLTESKGMGKAAGWLLFFFWQMYLDMSLFGHGWTYNLLGTLIAAELTGLLGYTDSIWKRCTFTMLFSALWGLMEMSVLLIFELCSGKDGTGAITLLLLSKAAMLPMVMGIRAFIKKNGAELKNEIFGEGISMALPLMAAMTVYYAFYMTIEQAGNRKEEIFCWPLLGTAGLVILHLSVYPFCIQWAENARIKKNERLYVRQLELYKKQKQLEEEEAVELRTKRHDLKQKLIYIQELARHEEKEKLMEMLAEMIGESGKKETLAGRTGNLVVDALVNNLCMKARSNKIRLNTRITVPGELNIDDGDLCILQGNAFDNAVEALEYVEEENREMWLEMKYERGSLLLNIRNRYSGELLKEENGGIKTRKKDGMHGLGLLSMKKVAEKYHGVLKAEGENGIFTLKVILYERF